MYWLITAAKTGQTAERQRDTNAMVLKLWNEDPRGAATRGPMSSLSSDGASFMRHSIRMMADGQMDGVLATLQLFDLDVGPGKISGVCDLKHVCKRFRARLKSIAREGGMKVKQFPMRCADDWRWVLRVGRSVPK